MAQPRRVPLVQPDPACSEYRPGLYVGAGDFRRHPGGGAADSNMGSASGANRGRYEHRGTSRHAGRLRSACRPALPSAGYSNIGPKKGGLARGDGSCGRDRDVFQRKRHCGSGCHRTLRFHLCQTSLVAVAPSQLYRHSRPLFGFSLYARPSAGCRRSRTVPLWRQPAYRRRFLDWATDCPQDHRQIFAAVTRRSDFRGTTLTTRFRRSAGS